MNAIPKLCAAGAMIAICGTATAEITANATVTNNYIWRGLTQTTNDAAVQGGIDYAHESGFYIGTWASNVKYAAADIFSYEHDIYLGFAGGDEFAYDVGWLYYSYDNVARFDFHEIYGSLGWKGLTVNGYLLSGTEAEEPPGLDFGFGSTYYVSLDYGYEFSNGLDVGVHVGRHSGDFNEVFNGVAGDYTDYSVSFGVKDFAFTITETDLDDSGFESLDNDATKIVVSYTWDFGLDD